MSKPGPRAILDLLVASEGPLRSREVRQQLSLSVATFGLSIRILERHGMVLRTNLLQRDASGENGALQLLVQATDLARSWRTSPGSQMAAGGLVA